MSCSRSLLDLQLRDTAAAATVRLRPGAQFRFQATENDRPMSGMRNRLVFVMTPAFLFGVRRVLVSQVDHSGPPELSHYAGGGG